MVSSFPLPLIEEPRWGYDKDDKLTGLHQCTLAENLKYSLNFLTKSISRNHQMRMSAKTMSTYTDFEPSITKNMIEVREACPGECKDRKREHLPWGSFYEWWRWALVLIYPQHEEYRWQLATTHSKTLRCFLPSPILSSLREGRSKISVVSSRWHFAGLFRFPEPKPSIKPFSSSFGHSCSWGPTQWGTALVCCIFILLSVLWNTRKIPEKLSWICFLPGEVKRYYITFPHFLAYEFPFKFLQWLPFHLLYHILVFHLYFKAPHSTSLSCVSALLSS